MSKEKKEERKKRVPLGMTRLKLQFPNRRGFVRRIINEIPGRLEAALEGGWQYVTTGTLDIESTDGKEPLEAVNVREGVDSRVSRVVGRNVDGSALRGYLMEIPEETYNADQEAKQSTVDFMESGIKQGIDQHGRPGEDGRYIPKTGISIKSTLG